MWKVSASRGGCEHGVSKRSVNITSEQSGEVTVTLDRSPAVIGKHIKPFKRGVCVTGGIMNFQVHPFTRGWTFCFICLYAYCYELDYE